MHWYVSCLQIMEIKGARGWSSALDLAGPAVTPTAAMPDPITDQETDIITPHDVKQSCPAEFK